MLLGALLILGRLPQAHAGEYVLQNTTNWRMISAYATESTAIGTDTPGQQSSGASDRVGATLAWNPDNAQDAPKPVKITVSFKATTGICFNTNMAADPYSYAKNGVLAGFVNRQNNYGNDTFYHYNIAFHGEYKFGSIKSGDAVKTLAGSQIIAEEVEISAGTDALAFNSTSTAKATSGELTGFTFAVQ